MCICNVSACGRVPYTLPVLAYRIGVATLSTPILYYPLLLTLYYPLPSTPYPLLPSTVPLTSTTPYLRADASAAPSRGERRTRRGTSPQSPGVPLAPRPSPRRPMTTREWRATRSRTALGAKATPFDKALILAVGLLQCLLQGRKSSKISQGSPCLVVLVRCELASAAVDIDCGLARRELDPVALVHLVHRARARRRAGEEHGRELRQVFVDACENAQQHRVGELSAGAPASGSACVPSSRSSSGTLAAQTERLIPGVVGHRSVFIYRRLKTTRTPPTGGWLSSSGRGVLCILLFLVSHHHSGPEPQVYREDWRPWHCCERRSLRAT